jgi:transcription elongation GreA/GreB family factor
MEPQRKITKTRYKKLQTKLKSLKESLTQLDKDVKYLAEAGKGWRFNNQLGDTMAKYDEINSKIKDLEKFLAESKVVENLDAGGRIVVGSTVKVKY